MKALTNLASGEGTLPGLQMAVFSYPHVVKRKSISNDFVWGLKVFQMDIFL